MPGAVLSVIRACIHERLAAAGVADEKSSEIADLVVMSLRRACGGETHYIPASDTAPRDAEIRAAWRAGVPIDTLAARHGLCERQVRRIIQPRPPGLAFSRADWDL